MRRVREQLVVFGVLVASAAGCGPVPEPGVGDPVSVTVPSATDSVVPGGSTTDVPLSSSATSPSPGVTASNNVTIGDAGATVASAQSRVFRLRISVAQPDAIVSVVLTSGAPVFELDDEGSCIGALEPGSPCSIIVRARAEGPGEYLGGIEITAASGTVSTQLRFVVQDLPDLFGQDAESSIPATSEDEPGTQSSPATTTR